VLLLFEGALQGAVLVRVVGGAVLPAAPDDVEPGAGGVICPELSGQLIYG
jgi:hypothetical protein